MKDRYGRPTTSLRISVTQDCNLDCFYCHNEGCEDEDREMTPDEIEELVKVATEFGIEKVKVTGGEPLFRDDIVDIISAISQPQIKDVSITTNGVVMQEKAEELSEAGLDRANISLDTLNEDTYEYISGKPALNDVLDGISASLEADLYPVKINTLVLEGINDDEIDDLIEYSIETGVILQLIELEKVLPENGEIYDKYHMDLDQIEKYISERASEVKTRWLMNARRKYIVDGGEVEIVNPMHNSEFCKYCTRLRMTPGGYLKPCLMRNDNLVDVLTPVREEDGEGIRKAYETAINRREPYFQKEDLD